ncbi:MAG: hypothetical protein GF308_12345 [Candidatus Heimdallarchaeota archaeon]|nr:hypothetical protein [Candidatus Heimdallarchaeota archaeon]
MGYEMTRPAQKWLGVGNVVLAFLCILFTLAVPYVNHFGEEGRQFSYYTKWSGRWRSDLLPPNTFESASALLDFPISASVLIGLGLLISVIGAGYLFWLTYSNKPCRITNEKPGPVGGAIVAFGAILAIIGNLIYENWAYGSPRPENGWPGTKNFLPETVRISPTFWIGFVLLLITFGLAITSVVYYFDTVSKRPVK